MKQRMSCLAVVVILCLSLAVIGVVLQTLNIIPDSAERTATAQARDLPTRIAAANATRHVELTASAEARVPTMTVIATDTPAPGVMTTLTELEQVEAMIATAEVLGQPLRAIFEQFEGVTRVEVVYLSRWAAGNVTVEARLDAPQSIVNRLLVEAQRLVPDMTTMMVTIASPDGRRIYYTWETVNPFWRPLDQENGQLLPTFAPGVDVTDAVVLVPTVSPLIAPLRAALLAHNIQSIDLAGAAQSQTVIIAVIVGADSGQEVLDMLRAVGQVVEGEPTIGGVSLVTGNAAGQTTAIINVLLADVQAWRAGELSDDVFIGRMMITDM